MNMRIQKALPGNRCFRNSLIVGLFILVLFLFYLIASRDPISYQVLFFPDKGFKSVLCYERRAVVKDHNQRRQLNNLIEELILGPMQPGLGNLFPKQSKLLSLWITNDLLHLNFNKATLNSLSKTKADQHALNYLLMQSIINTVCFNDHSIKRVKFYFDGKSYRFIGNYGPVDQGIKPDWNLLK